MVSLREKAQVFNCSRGLFHPDCWCLSGSVAALLSWQWPHQPPHWSSHMSCLSSFEPDISPPKHLDGFFFKSFTQLSGRGQNICQCIWKFSNTWLFLYPSLLYVSFFLTTTNILYSLFGGCFVFCLPFLKCKLFKGLLFLCFYHCFFFCIYNSVRFNNEWVW